MRTGTSNQRFGPKNFLCAFVKIAQLYKSHGGILPAAAKVESEVGKDRSDRIFSIVEQVYFHRLQRGNSPSN